MLPSSWTAYERSLPLSLQKLSDAVIKEFTPRTFDADSCEVRRTIDRLSTLRAEADILLATMMLALRFELNRRLPIHKLPPEILSHIFSYSCNDDYTRFSLHALMAVSQTCRRWRDVALAHPSLWATIDLDGMNLKLADLFVQRSGGYPLSLYRESYAGEVVKSDAMQDCNRFLRNVYLTHGHRIRLLHLRIQSGTPLPAGDFPQLEVLQVSPCIQYVGEAERTLGEILALRQPALRQLVWQDMTIGDLRTSLPNLTHLCLRELQDSLDLSALLRVLSGAPLLEELDLNFRRGFPTATTPSDDLRFPNLRTLSLGFPAQCLCSLLSLMRSSRVPQLFMLSAGLGSDASLTPRDVIETFSRGVFWGPPASTTDPRAAVSYSSDNIDIQLLSDDRAPQPLAPSHIVIRHNMRTDWPVLELLRFLPHILVSKEPQSRAISAVQSLSLTYSIDADLDLQSSFETLLTCLPNLRVLRLCKVPDMEWVADATTGGNNDEHNPLKPFPFETLEIVDCMKLGRGPFSFWFPNHHFKRRLPGKRLVFEGCHFVDFDESDMVDAMAYVPAPGVRVEYIDCTSEPRERAEYGFDSWP